MKKFALLLLEIIIGISLLSLLLFLGINKYSDYINLNPSYTVSFKDIDGLGIGSPVKLMGLQIGNVTKLEMLDSEIYVTFRNMHREIKVPEGSTATVSFTGLAGSKSLEILPPEHSLIKKDNMFQTIEPVRINSVFEVQISIFENILEFTRGILAFVTKQNSDSLQSSSKTINQIIDEQNKNINFVKKSMEDLAKEESIQNNITNVKTNVENISKSVDLKKANEKIANLSENVTNLNTRLEKFNTDIKKVKEREAGYVGQMSNSIKKTSDGLLKFIDTVRDKQYKEENKGN